MIEKLILVARQKELFDAWSQVFESNANVELVLGDIFDYEADAMVSPANSFGIMDGGLDLYIREKLGFETEDKVQEQILKCHHGELPVGSAIIVRTNNEKWPYLISAPTMRVPEDVSNTLNSYLAFRAVLLCVRNFNESGKGRIKTIVCPGLATGAGHMPARRCAAQMRVAFDYLNNPARIPSYQQIHEVHRKLHSAI